LPAGASPHYPLVSRINESSQHDERHVLFFDVPPLTAVSSDLVASAVMKPVASLVHLRRGTVHLGLVKWQCLGSVPAACGGVFIARALGEGEQVQSVIRTALAIALLEFSASTVPHRALDRPRHSELRGPTHRGVAPRPARH
jgi:uncharacterized membrane protein YfcA